MVHHYSPLSVVSGVLVVEGLKHFLSLLEILMY